MLESLNSYILIWVGIVGLCLGSFFNVVILRSLSEESIVFPPSKCPKCGTKLKPWHNIPVISYIFLRGKCAFCKEKISIQYPIVEILTGIFFVMAFIKFGMSLQTLFLMFWISCLIIMTGTDLKEKVVDCNIAIVMAISGLIYSVINSGMAGLKNSFFGLFLGVLVIEIVAKIGYLFKKGRAMGEADTFVAGALGAIIGGQNICTVLLYAFISSMIFILPMYWYARYKANDKWSFVFSILFLVGITLNQFFPGEYFTLAIIILSGLGLVICVIKSMRDETKLNILPFVPALAAGALYYLLF